MNQLSRLSLILLSLFLVSCSVFHEKPKTDTHKVSHSSLALDKNIHALLQQEMRAIQTGMSGLIPLLARGDWDQIAKTGRAIQNSYLLKQKLSAEQRHTLHKTLPAEFIKKDQAFHRSAGMLAHAAEMQNAELTSFYFYKLTSACIECHSEYATEKFPNLIPRNDAHHH